MQNYEIEVKSLLGALENANSLRERMQELDPDTALISKNKQLNHYFTEGSLSQLLAQLAPYLSNGAQERLADIAEQATDFSVRSREKDGKVLIVVKASVDDTTSANGIARIELEEEVPLTLYELDVLVLAAGFEYQAKWSREREEYVCKGTNVCLDKNAGYGYLAEFERVTSEESELQQVRDEVYALMRELGVEELPQDRLQRMFEHYNEHWPEYYGTEKVFVIE